MTGYTETAKTPIIRSKQINIPHVTKGGIEIPTF